MISSPRYKWILVQWSFVMLGIILYGAIGLCLILALIHGLIAVFLLGGVSWYFGLSIGTLILLLIVYVIYIFSGYRAVERRLRRDIAEIQDNHNRRMDHNEVDQE